MTYACLNSPVGSLTLFEDAGALVAVEWGRAPDPVSTPLLETALEQLRAFFNGRLRNFELPTNPAGTPFQRSVWRLMEAIPLGETRTYGDLARDLGTSPRPVGGACGRNPIPIIIPCHRVVGADGRLTGYSGAEGLDTKRALLRLEGVVIP
jgi:methylated-DNA-[protein]-cysteine S-methyltransferase